MPEFLVTIQEAFTSKNDKLQILLEAEGIFVDTFEELFASYEVAPEALSPILKKVGDMLLENTTTVRLAPQAKRALFCSLENLLIGRERINKSETFVSEFLFPHWREILAQYTKNPLEDMVRFPMRYDFTIRHPDMLHPYIWYLLEHNQIHLLTGTSISYAENKIGNLIKKRKYILR